MTVRSARVAVAIEGGTRASQRGLRYERLQSFCGNGDIGTSALDTHHRSPKVEGMRCQEAR
eukprot:3083975-Pleurochrysis_carterae.AAC.1